MILTENIIHMLSSSSLVEVMYVRNSCRARKWHRAPQEILKGFSHGLVASGPSNCVCCSQRFTAACRVVFTVSGGYFQSSAIKHLLSSSLVRILEVVPVIPVFCLWRWTRNGNNEYLLGSPEMAFSVKCDLYTVILQHSIQRVASKNQESQ